MKITTLPDCFCNSVHNIIIQWNCHSSADEKKCFNFIENCPIRHWIRINNLKESRIYYKENRESKVWLFIPDYTYIESLPHPKLSSNYHHECCLSLSSASSSSSSFPIGLIPCIELSLISSHCNGIFLEFKRTNHLYHEKFQQYYYLLLNIDKIIQSSDKLFYQQTIKLFNIWCIFIGSQCSENKDQCTNFYALLIPGIYSSSSIMLDNKLLCATPLKQTVQCQNDDDCFHFDEQFSKKKFSLLIHDLNYLLKFCLIYQINQLQNKHVIHSREYALKYKDCTLSKLFQRLLLNLYIESRNLNFKSYQYAEDFIQFPYISELQENDQSSIDILNESIINLHDICDILRSVDKSNNVAEEIHTISTLDQCFKCIYTTYCTQISPSSSSSLSKPMMNHSLDVHVRNTLLQLKLNPHKVHHYHHHQSLKHLTLNSSNLNQPQTTTPITSMNHSKSPFYVIGKIQWDNTYGCFCLQTLQKNIFNYFHNNNNNNMNNHEEDEKANTIITIPLIIDMMMNASNEMINVLFLPFDNSLVLLNDIEIMYTEEYYSMKEVISLGNCESKKPSHVLSKMYIYPKQIIPLQLNHLSESRLDEWEQQPQHNKQSCSLILLRLGPLSTVVSTDSTECSTSPTNNPLWTYVFVGKSIEDTTTTTTNTTDNLIYLSLTGDLAYRWYYRFQIGSHYQLHWLNIIDKVTVVDHHHHQSSTTLQHLIHVSIIVNTFNPMMDNRNPYCCTIVPLNDLLKNRTNYPIGCLLNFEAIILFYSIGSLNDDWLLWIIPATASSSDGLSQPLSHINTITTVYKVTLSKKYNTSVNYNNNNLDLISSLFTMFNQSRLYYCRFTDFSLSAINQSESLPSSSSLVNLHLNYTNLSRITLMNQTDIDPVLNQISTQLSDSLIISFNDDDDDEIDNSLIVVSKKSKLSNITDNHNYYYDWIARPISVGYLNGQDDVSSVKECIHVQATIIRCLEFQVYRLPPPANTAGDDDVGGK
ncbi:unnamed protein product [Schistosoma turkestanicum]|nr:unnamed protein product [Schistosoma turkestanicum]